MSTSGDSPGMSRGPAHDQRDLVVRNIGRLTTWHGPDVERAAVVIQGGVVSWTGPDAHLPLGLPEIEEYDAHGAAVLPGFVDSHTHAVWAGSRRDDFIGRLSGEPYSPHGIQSTVDATRAATDERLQTLARRRVDEMLHNGTTTVEVKSGYGLTVDDELRILRVAGALQGPRIETTYLGAHVVPDGRDRADYIDEVTATIPRAKAAGAVWCDVFCDEGAFTVDEARHILTTAQRNGLGTRMHAEQLAHTGAARLAAELGCASADHLDHVSDEDARALAQAGVVATLVPVASLYSRSMNWQHATTLLEAGCTLAVATDCNPGTAWCESMPYAMQLACLAMGLPVETVLRAATLGGAAALRRTDVGHLGVGAKGDLVVVNSDHAADLLGHLGAIAVIQTVVDGCPIG